MRDFVDLDVERTVIGCAMGGRTALFDLTAVLPEHFADLRHGAIWGLIQQMDGAGEPVTPQTVAANLPRVPADRRAGIDLVWLFDSYQMGAPISMAPSMGARLRDLAQMRRIGAALGRSQQVLDGEGEPGEVLETIRDLIDSAEPDGPQGRMLGDEIDETVNSFYEQSVIYETPWAELNQLMQGWRPGGLYVVGARPGVGKSIFGLQAAVALANLGPVAVNSLEMARHEVHVRIISSLTGIPQSHLMGKRKGFSGPSAKDDEALARDLPAIRELPISIDDRSSISVMDIRAHARSLSRRGRLAGVVVDYLQLMSGVRGDRRPRHEIVADQSRQLKILAKELECPVIALSQLNRASESRDSKAPSLADLRESGAIEQDADAVILLHIPDLEGVTPPQPDLESLVVTVAKNRQGEIGRFQLMRDGSTAYLTSKNNNY